MFIKLTNANPMLKDSTVVINSDCIVSIFSVEISRDETQPDVKENLTCVFCPPHGTWEVKETAEEIADLINP
jgi:hypothetical protein